MGNSSRTAKAGFTLIEIMIVVAIIGVMSSLGLAGYKRYIYKSRSAEAITNIEGIFKALRTYYNSETVQTASTSSTGRVHCVPASSGWKPVTPPDMEKHVADWSTDATYKAIGYAPDGPTAFSYRVTGVNQCGITSQADVITIDAATDYEGDGDYDGVRMTLAVRDEQLVISGREDLFDQTCSVTFARRPMPLWASGLALALVLRRRRRTANASG